MQLEKYLIDLAAHISAKNVNFYLDTYEAMCAVNQKELQHINDAELIKMQKLIFERGLEKNPRAAIETLLAVQSVNNCRQSVGRFILSNLRLGKFDDKCRPCSDLPFIFLNYSIVEDLLLHGHGPWYALVEKIVREVDHPDGINPLDRHSTIQELLHGYIPMDMAALFGGYSLLNNNAYRAIVPFPANKTGFVARLFRDTSELLPDLS